MATLRSMTPVDRAGRAIPAVALAALVVLVAASRGAVSAASKIGPDGGGAAVVTGATAFLLLGVVVVNVVPSFHEQRRAGRVPTLIVLALFVGVLAASIVVAVGAGSGNGQAAVQGLSWALWLSIFAGITMLWASRDSLMGRGR